MSITGQYWYAFVWENEIHDLFGLPVEMCIRDRVIRTIDGITAEAEVGKSYTGKVTRIMNFGAFVEILPGKEGLVHISQLSTEHVDKVEDVVSVGDEIAVKCVEIDSKGRINLSRKAILQGK